MKKLIFFVFVALCGLAACGVEDQGQKDDGMTSAVCVPGRVVTCACVGAAMGGVQACLEDGSGWGACACPDVTSPAPDMAGDMSAGETQDLGGEADMAAAVDMMAEVDMAPPEVDMTPLTPLERGEQLFQTYCAPCHCATAMGGMGPNLIEEISEELGKDPRAEVRGDILKTIANGDGAMPAIGVSSEEAGLIADYLLSISE